MTEFARGGRIEGEGVPAILFPGCDYVIPAEFARKWAESLLENLNRGLDSPTEDGVE